MNIDNVPLHLINSMGWSGNYVLDYFEGSPMQSTGISCINNQLLSIMSSSNMSMYVNF